jgi:hypothetical protein
VFPGEQNMSLELTQQEAESLLAMEKKRANDQQYLFSEIKSSLRIPLRSHDGREEFSLDIYRGKIELLKNTYQNRARKTVVLARLDIGGSPHRNPDGQEIDCPHLHLYREGHGGKWAFAVPQNFANVSDAWQSLQDFMNYCNITTKPEIQKGLLG